jgi:hypothetical protein
MDPSSHLAAQYKTRPVMFRGPYFVRIQPTRHVTTRRLPPPRPASAPASGASPRAVSPRKHRLPAPIPTGTRIPHPPRLLPHPLGVSPHLPSHRALSTRRLAPPLHPPTVVLRAVACLPIFSRGLSPQLHSLHLTPTSPSASFDCTVPVATPLQRAVFYEGNMELWTIHPG